MPDPVILSASAIATLAFQEFVKSGAGELKFCAKNLRNNAILGFDRRSPEILRLSRHSTKKCQFL